MTVLTEGRHAAEFILSEANGQRSRENGTVASGQTLSAGQIVKKSGGNLVAYDGVTASDVVGIVLDNVDASDGAKPAAYIARDAEVNGNVLTYPDESTAGGEEARSVSGLALLGIIAR